MMTVNIMTWILSLFVIQTACVLVSFSQNTTINRVCKANRPGLCYTLYKLGTGPLTWTQAQQTCLIYNETMATVPDIDTQQLLEQLIQSNDNAWLAGKVDQQSESWQSLKREIYEQIPLQSDDTSINCGFLKVDDAVSEILASSCTDYRQSLCSYLSGSTCNNGDVHIGSICLHQINDAFTWYSALMACDNLGYSLMRYERGLLTLNTSYLMKGNFWLDVHRYTWEWKTGKFPSVTVQYFNWAKQSGNNIPASCMYVSGNTGKWRSQLCNSTKDVSYFVCENETPLSPQDTTPFTTENRTAFDKNNPKVNIAPDQSSKTQTAVSQNTIIAVSVVVVLVCVMVIVVVVVWYTVRKKSIRQSQQSSNGFSYTMSTIERTARQGNVYDDGAVVADDTNNDVPYVYRNEIGECTTVADNGDGHARADNERNERMAASGTQRRGSGDEADGTAQAMTSVERIEGPVDYVYAKVNKERKRRTENDDVMIDNVVYHSH